jgi:DNA-binding transcriptional ArsR family regulator
VHTDRLSATLSALADPTRRGILARLATGQATVTELAEPYDMSMAAVSKHLKVLETAGLISRGREAQWRPCRLEPAPLRDVAQWLEEYRRFWDESFDRLDGFLRQMRDGTDNESGS